MSVDSGEAAHLFPPRKAAQLLRRAARCVQPPQGLTPMADVTRLMASPRPTGSSETNTGSRIRRAGGSGLSLVLSDSCVNALYPRVASNSVVVIRTQLGHKKRERLGDVDADELLFDHVGLAMPVGKHDFHDRPRAAQERRDDLDAHE